MSTLIFFTKKVHLYVQDYGGKYFILGFMKNVDNRVSLRLPVTTQKNEATVTITTPLFDSSFIVWLVAQEGIFSST